MSEVHGNHHVAEPQRKPQALAHITEDGREHALDEHLREVGRIAAEFANAFTSEEWAKLAGVWHDVGKYAQDFQAMLQEARDANAHIEGQDDAPPGKKRRVDHSSAGAVLAMEQMPKTPGALAVALCIAGHHAGLANYKGGEGRSLDERLRETAGRLQAARAGGFAAEGQIVPPQLPELLSRGKQSKGCFELWTRMLFSALVDADFLDTEAFFDGERTEGRRGYATLSELKPRFDDYMARLTEDAVSSPVNRARAEVLSACRKAARGPAGVYSLTVPTGGGKTLAALAFALEHAEKHGQRRIIFGIPFTSIIEQTAAVYRAALGDEAVLEHHSSLDPATENARNRLASENWDAPVVVTTNVQLLESLFANRSSACRKLHRIAGSVLILDEAQTLPVGLLDPVLQVLRTLVADYGVTLVLCTATQPALGQREALPNGFEHVTEIIGDAPRLFTTLKRTRFEWPTNSPRSAPPTNPWHALAERLADETSVLAIVDRRQDAIDLTAALDEALDDDSAVHLSALMSPAHRSEVLSDIKARLKQGRPLRVVSTQLVEAGVDVDFPVVYRALAGLDALAQAAGRCNREGRLRAPDGSERLGRVVVFDAPRPPPRGLLRAGYEVTRALLANDASLDPTSPTTIDHYFRKLYFAQDKDTRRIEGMRQALQFREVARAFKIIDDGQSGIVIPYGDQGQRCVSDLERFGVSRFLLRRLQRFTVSVHKAAFEAWQREGCLENYQDQVFVLKPAFRHHYTLRFGLSPQPSIRYSPDSLMG